MLNEEITPEAISKTSKIIKTLVKNNRGSGGTIPTTSRFPGRTSIESKLTENLKNNKGNFNQALIDTISYLRSKDILTSDIDRLHPNQAHKIVIEALQTGNFQQPAIISTNDTPVVRPLPQQQDDNKSRSSNGVPVVDPRREYKDRARTRSGGSRSKSRKTAKDLMNEVSQIIIFQRYIEKPENEHLRIYYKEFLDQLGVSLSGIKNASSNYIQAAARGKTDKVGKAANIAGSAPVLGAAISSVGGMAVDKKSDIQADDRYDDLGLLFSKTKDEISIIVQNITLYRHQEIIKASAGGEISLSQSDVEAIKKLVTTDVERFIHTSKEANFNNELPDDNLVERFFTQKEVEGKETTAEGYEALQEDSDYELMQPEDYEKHQKTLTQKAIYDSIKDKAITQLNEQENRFFGFYRTESVYNQLSQRIESLEINLELSNSKIQTLEDSNKTMRGELNNLKTSFQAILSQLSPSPSPATDTKEQPQTLTAQSNTGGGRGEE